ncbi:MAG: DUF87 domain-containing protein [Spirochaetaceae bacterium]|jgi:type IV secretion system protein VirB4|nr:DUF87 domain-containing protein [Spirochaetaceae bacterium]
MSASTAYFYTQIPWNYISKHAEGVVLQKDGVMQRTFAYRAPDVDSCSPFEINGLCLRVNDFTKRLGTGWAFFIEAQRFYTCEYPDAESYGGGSGFDRLAPYLIDKERQAAFLSAGRHFESSFFITFTYRPPSDSIKKLTSWFVHSDSGDGDGKIMRENINFFVNETNAVVGLLSSAMNIAPLNNEQTLAYLHSAISLNRHYIKFPPTQIMLDRILPDTALVNSLTMKLGAHYIPIVGINDFPEETYPAILDHLNRERMEYRWVSRYICLGKEDGKKEAQKKEKAHRGNKKSFFQTFAESTSKDGTSGSQTLNHGATVKEGDSIEAGIEIETDAASLGCYTSCVMVWDEDYKTALKKRDRIINIINSAGFTCKEETFNALEAFKSMMPGQIYANYRALPVMSYTLSHILPLSSVWAGMRDNPHAGKISGVDAPHLTCSTQEGTPFFLNINPSDVGHTAVWGPTGAGKSTLLNLLEAQFFKYPSSRVIVFDKGKSCRQICLASGGLFYEPAAESLGGVSFQPLRHLDTDTDIMNAMDFIESLFTVTNYPVTPKMRTAIKACLDLLREKHEDGRTLTDFIHYIQYMDDETKKPVFKEQLADYLWDGGKYGKIFDSRSSGLSLNTRFLAIEMEELMNRGAGAVVPALVYLFNLVEKMFDGNLTLLVLDEAGLFLKNETFSQKIAEWLKVLRKKNVFVLFATQDVADAFNSPLRTTIIQQCLTKIYLADPAALTAGMFPVYSGFGLTESEIALIASSEMKRDYFYTSPLGRRKFQLDLGHLTLALIGSPNHQLLDSLVKEHGPGVPLCRRILEALGVRFRQYLSPAAPDDEATAQKIRENAEKARKNGFFWDESAAAPLPPEAEPAQNSAEKAAAILDAAAALPEHSKKGAGRSADALAQKLCVSPTTIYQARRLLRAAPPELLAQVRKGDVSIKKAYRLLRQMSETQAEAEGE